jgi:hypothetical protein
MFRRFTTNGLALPRELLFTTHHHIYVPRCVMNFHTTPPHVSAADDPSFVKFSELPICNECKFCNHNITEGFNYKNNTCRLFGERSIVTGEIEHEFIFSCRRKEELCGENGKYFVKIKSLMLKNIMHNVRLLFIKVIWPIVKFTAGCGAVVIPALYIVQNLYS